MSKFVGYIMDAIEIGVGIATQNWWLVGTAIASAALQTGAMLLAPKDKRQAAATQVQVGEITRRGMLGEGATAGSLVDAFNYGGKYGTDWTVLVIALADHRCDSLIGFYANETYVTFGGDGVVPDPSDTVKFRGQLQVYWRPGTWDQDVPGILTENCPVVDGKPTWTASDRGRGVSYVVVAYKADKSDAKHPVWSTGQPNFLWVLKGALCYSARADDTVGGSGTQRWEDPTTRAWSDNVIDCRYTWARGFYAGDKIDQPEMLLLGRGLSDVEAPAVNTFAPGNLCDEQVPLKGVLSSLSAAASRHDTSITLTSVTGLANGTSILISQEGGFDETVEVQSIAGNVVTLTGGLAFDHPVLTPASWAASAGTSEARYRIGGVFGGDDAFIDTENDFAAACGGWIVEREGSVELVPGAAQPVVWHINDDDLIVGSTVTANDFRSITDDMWCNSVAATYTEPTQKWAQHSAPIHRVYADVIADGKPRTNQPSLQMVTSGTQAQRVAEQQRRMGRLWRTRSIVLGPRFIGAEHGDWISWTSTRYGPKPTAAVGGIALEDGTGDIAREDGGAMPLEGTRLLLRIESDGQDVKWQNSLSFAEVAADVFDWNAPEDELSDGAVAVQASAPSFGDAPAAGSWALAAATETSDGAVSAALVFTGACDDDQADAVVFEYAAGTAGPDADDDAAWTVGTTALNISTTRAEVTGVMMGTTYWGAVSYRVGGAQGDRLVLGPVTTASGSGTEGRVVEEDGGRQLGEDGSQIIKE